MQCTFVLMNHGHRLQKRPHHPTFWACTAIQEMNMSLLLFVLCHQQERATLSYPRRLGQPSNMDNGSTSSCIQTTISYVKCNITSQVQFQVKLGTSTQLFRIQMPHLNHKFKIPSSVESSHQGNFQNP